MYDYRLEIKNLTADQIESIGEVCLKLLSREHSADETYTLNMIINDIPKLYTNQETDKEQESTNEDCDGNSR